MKFNLSTEMTNDDLTLLLQPLVNTGYDVIRMLIC